VGYNVQTAVDVMHHLIVAHEVTNVGHDRDQLASMAKLAKAVTGKVELIALADRGYYEGYEILECERSGVAAVVPKPMTSNNLADGLFDKRDFVYDARNDEYRCPAGKIAIYRFTAEEAGKIQHKYWSSDCPHCPMKPRCTKGKYRRISRWEHEDILDVVQERLEDAPEAMKLRRQTVEHVFGTFKAWMGMSHFLTKTLPRVRTEMSLQVLAYNLKRAIKTGHRSAMSGPSPRQERTTALAACGSSVEPGRQLIGAARVQRGRQAQCRNFVQSAAPAWAARGSSRPEADGGLQTLQGAMRLRQERRKRDIATCARWTLQARNRPSRRRHEKAPRVRVLLVLPGRLWRDAADDSGARTVDCTRLGEGVQRVPGRRAGRALRYGSAVLADDLTLARREARRRPPVLRRRLQIGESEQLQG
jgi:hypothetical protein